MRLISTPLWLLVVGWSVNAQAVFAATWTEAIRGTLRGYCYDCHQGPQSDGGLDLTSLSDAVDDPKTMALWIRVHDRIQSGEMPPADVSPLPETTRKLVVNELSQSLTAAHEREKGTILRRLNRREYQNTLNDLFGTHLDLENMLPEDGRLGEFDNIGQSLGLSSTHIDQYLQAIELVLQTAIENRTTLPEPKVITASYADTREGKQFIGKVWKLLDDGAVVFFRNFGYPSGMLRDANVRESGNYRIRITGYAYQSENPITFRLGAKTFQRGVEEPTIGYFELPPGNPTTIEVTTWIDSNFMIAIDPWGLDSQGDYNIRTKGLDGYTGPGLAISSVELTGPIVEQFPSRGHQLVLSGLDRQEVMPRNPSDRNRSSYRPTFDIHSNDPTTDARGCLQRVAMAAFRRPVAPEELDRYVELFQQSMDNGAKMEEGLRSAVAAIFCSPDFLFLFEPDGMLHDHALAARLSYFLTRSAPDTELLAAAASGTLASDQALLINQMRRLMSSERFDRFIVDFTDAWLNLREFRFTNPDEKLYPEFDSYLEYSMLQETQAFVRRMIAENRPVHELIQPPFAMLNERLAAHYGMDGIDHADIRAVKLEPTSMRGGLLGQASVLKVSANGTNTSPVVRGVYVMDRILAQTPPPPPPGIPGVEPDIRGATTLRELLDKHRDLESCQHCHEMIDPPGFALESFDPIGGYRERFRSLGEGERVNLEIRQRKVQYRLGPEVDATGSLPGKREFNGFLKFREHLVAQPEVLAQAWVTKVLTFATGREMGFSDRPIINSIVSSAKASRYGLRDLMERVVLSEVFRTK